MSDHIKCPIAHEIKSLLEKGHSLKDIRREVLLLGKTQRPLYRELICKVDAYRHCIQNKNSEWEEKHKAEISVRFGSCPKEIQQTSETFLHFTTLTTAFQVIVGKRDFFVIFSNVDGPFVTSTTV